VKKVEIESWGFIWDFGFLSQKVEVEWWVDLGFGVLGFGFGFQGKRRWLLL
jgi:hypothetical protein